MQGTHNYIVYDHHVRDAPSFRNWLTKKFGFVEAEPGRAEVQSGGKLFFFVIIKVRIRCLASSADYIQFYLIIVIVYHLGQLLRVFSFKARYLIA
jgi:hypothetical protein